MKVSRRKLLQVLPVAAAAVPLASNVAAQAPPGAIPTSADAELEGARQYLRTGVRVVRQVELPMATEPATRFSPRT